MAEAGQKIGLNTRYKSVTLGQLYGLFGGPDGWKEVDADGFGAQYNFPVADPQAHFRIWADPADFENYGGFTDAESTTLISEASAATDPVARADLLAQADARLFELMPWIPVVDVASTLYMSKDVTGPPASFVNWWYPWAADLGGSSPS
jgi:peptide/nickel transport system substrate-binding protein